MKFTGPIAPMGKLATITTFSPLEILPELIRAVST
jgi:hypothetical protein